MRLALRILRGAWTTVAAAVACGLIGGLSIVGLIGLIQAELRKPSPSPAGTGLAFLLLCLVGVAARSVAQTATVHAGQRAIAEMVVDLSRRLLGLSLRAFEQVDTSKVMAALTEDVVIAL